MAVERRSEGTESDSRHQKGVWLNSLSTMTQVGILFLITGGLRLSVFLIDETAYARCDQICV